MRAEDHQEFATAGGVNRAVGANVQFVGPPFDAPQHIAGGVVEFHHVEFIVQRYPFGVDAGPELAAAVEGDVVKLPAVVALTKEFPMDVEPLDTSVLAVGHIEVAVGSEGNPVHQVEFTRAGAAFTLLGDFLARPVVFQHAAIAVTVADEDMAVVGG